VRRLRDQRAGSAGCGPGRHRGGPRRYRARSGHGRPGLLVRTGPAVLLRAGPDVPAGRSLVQLVPGPDLPQPPVPDRGHGARPDRRLALRPARLSASRDHLRPADRARYLVDQLPPHGQRAAPVAALRAAQPQDDQAPPALRGPVGTRGVPGRAEGHPVHRGRLPARDRPVHAARPRPGPVLRRRRPRHAAGGQHRGPGLRGLLGGEPAGHQEGRELRRGGDQPGHARCRLAAHRADLGLRRARRVLRPRAAAARDPARRRRGPQRYRQPERADHLPAGGCPRPGPEQGEPEPGAAAVRPVRVPGPGRDRVAVRAARLRQLANLRPHLGAQAGRTEVEPARADRAGRGTPVMPGRRWTHST
jgi:hypothetical protein